MENLTLNKNNKNIVIEEIALNLELKFRLIETLENKGFIQGEINGILTLKISELEEVLNYCHHCGNYFLSGDDKYIESDKAHCESCHDKLYSEDEWDELYEENDEEYYYTTEE